MTREEAKIKELTGAFIDRLVSIEREYWAAQEVEKNDLSAMIEYADSVYYDVYKEIEREAKAIEKEVIEFQEKYDLSDLFVDTIYQIAVDEFKLEKKLLGYRQQNFEIWGLGR